MPAHLNSSQMIEYLDNKRQKKIDEEAKKSCKRAEREALRRQKNKSWNGRRELLEKLRGYKLKRITEIRRKSLGRHKKLSNCQKESATDCERLFRWVWIQQHGGSKWLRNLSRMQWEGKWWWRWLGCLWSLLTVVSCRMYHHSWTWLPENWFP